MRELSRATARAGPSHSAYLILEGTATQCLSVMGFWRALRPRLRNPFLEVRYEDLVTDVKGTARRALRFLGLDWDAQVLQFDEHARGRVVRSLSYAEFAKPITKRAVGRWQNYRRQLEPQLARLELMLAALDHS